MKSIIFLSLTFMLCLVSCNNQDDVVIGQNKFIDEIQTIYPKTKNSNETIVPYKYLYNTDNQLIEIKNKNSSYKFIYENKQLIERKNTNNVVVYSIDSMFYSSNNMISKIKTYQKNESSIFELFTIEYLYRNADNQISTKVYETYYGNKRDTSLITTNSWRNGNLIQESVTDKKGKGRWINSYKYDDKQNPFKLLPNEYGRMELVSENNIKEMKITDFTGLIDYIANPIKYSYDYDRDGFPTKISSNVDRKQIIKYKKL